MRYSTDFPRVPVTELPAPIRGALAELSALRPGVKLEPIRWSETYIGVSVEIDVDLPSRGPVDGIDIRPIEPVILVFHRSHYPLSAPSAFSDRKDFPADRLPHLNPMPPGHAASLCLHRGKIDDWFAEHDLRDFVERIRSWMRDAGRNRLIRSADQFEPTRFSDTSGTFVFDPGKLERRARERWKEFGGAPGHAYFHATLTGSERETAGWSTSYSVRLDFMLEGAPDQSNTELVTKWNSLPAETRKFERWLLGLTLWPEERETVRYLGHLPHTYAELRVLAAELGFAFVTAIEEYFRLGARQGLCIPVTMALLRPRPLIGTSSSIEWVSFLIFPKDDQWPDGAEPQDDAAVYPIGHRRPLTPAFASELSGLDSAPGALARPVLLGCGAVGSKVALHLAKSGTTDQLLVDDATLTPHHLVRHGLPAGALGKKKAEGLKDEIAALFGRALQTKPEAHVGSAVDVLQDAVKLKARTTLIDASASPGVLNALTSATLMLRVFRCEIADQGRLGILSHEGEGRNPRVDDLQAYLWGLAVENQEIGEWLRRHREEIEGARGPVLEEIGIGMGCSSETMRLADDAIAYHTSQFALSVRHLAASTAESRGCIRISRLADGCGCQTVSVHVRPVHAMRVRNEHDWTVRLAQPGDALIREEFRRAGQRETGGVLIGYLHRKRATAYITHVLPASPDSRGTPAGFSRGVIGYSETIERIERQTAGLLGYVGEWHTHPRGRAEPSRTDVDTMRKTRAVLGTAGIPALMLIMAPGGMKAYIYG